MLNKVFEEQSGAVKVGLTVANIIIFIKIAASH